MATRARIAPGRLRELGLVNWAICRVLSRASGVPDARLFSTLGQARGLFRGWLHFSGRLMPGGRLARFDTELVILRVAHLTECQYEQDHHRRLGRRAGITREMCQRIETGPQAPEWSERERTILTAVDELVRGGDIPDETWVALTGYFDSARLLELVMLVHHYLGLARTIAVLRIGRDEFPCRKAAAVGETG